MKNQDNTDGWNDGWHTQASTGDSVNTLRDSILGTANAAGKSAITRDSNHETKPDGWSDDHHANASPRESLSALRDSAVKTATTREGWWKIARGTGKVVAVTAAVGFVVVRNALHETDLHDESENLPFGAVPGHPLNNPHAGIYYDIMGDTMDRTGAYHDDD